MEVDAPSVLLPCAICGRTFMPRSLEKHVKICERAATKKRKPFDSAKQRIQGTDLAEFLPRQEKKRNLYEERRKSSWKETHDDFLQTIRAARGRTSDTDGQVAQRQSSSHASSGVPMRANEKGTCPTCNRRFGVKAYERHVAWCKERSTRLPNHLPTTNNVAKERLEARMKYRAPNLKNRRTSNRDKCSQGSASAPNITGAAGKTSNETTVRNASSRASRRRETVSVSDVRRSEKSKESQRSAVTVTSRGELSTSVQNSTDPSEGTNLTKHSSQLTDSGTCKEYDPFLLAERQMHDLLSDSSDLSTTVTEVGLSEHARKGSSKRRETLYPLSHSSAFVEYPSRDQSSSACLDKRSAAIAVSNGNGEFEQLVSDLSSDSTETNSISREIFLRGYRDSKERDREKEENSRGRSRSDSSKRELGRRLILDKSIVLGNDLIEGLSNRTGRRFVTEKLATKNSRSVSSRSQPIRAYSAPKSIYERNGKTNDGNRDGENANIEKRDRANAILDNDRKNDYAALSSSDLSLSSIVSSEVDIKRSNSVLDELITSFEDDVLGNDSFPSLRSLLRNESLQSYESCNGPANTRQQHCDRISDEEEFSSPDNYKQQEHKFNADSAYSSLNRKSNYSNHGRSTNDGTNRFEESSSRNNRRENQTSTPMSTGKTRCRMSRFCHECGSRFLETAKFCCQCGVKRLAL